MKDQLKNLVKSLCLFLLLAVSGCEKDIYENAVQDKNKLIIKNVSLKQLARNENVELFKAVDKVRISQDAQAKMVYDSINKFYFNDENGKEIIAPNGKKSYTFPIYTLDDNTTSEKKVENIVFYENFMHEYEAYKIKYGFTEEQLKTLSKQELELLPAIYTNLTTKQVEPLCAFILTWVPYPNDQGNLTGNFSNEGHWVVSYVVCDSTPPYSGTTQAGGGSNNNPNSPYPITGGMGGYTTPVVLDDEEKAWADYAEYTRSLPADLQDWLSLEVNSRVNGEIFKFLTLNGYSGSNRASVKNFIKICDELEENPNILLDIPCAELQNWLTLAQYNLPISTINKISNLQDINSETVPSWDIQFLGSAQGAVVNMDFFPVTISQFPINPSTGQPFTPQQFYNFFRLNISQFVAGTGVSFAPSTISGINESTLWNSSNPLNSIISINISPDSGSVICSNYTNSHWYFTTLTTPWTFSWTEDDYDGYHPVSGNREFGYYQNVNGNYVFYVRGVDRIHRKNVQRIARNLPGANSEFDGSDNLWNNMKESIKLFVNSNGGTAVSNQNIIYRPNWTDIKDVLSGAKPLSDLGCDD